MSGPLADILIVDLSRVLAGPFCTMMLAELGARVIKVETPHGGDDARHFEPFHEGMSAYFSSLNRGKESIALDLKKPADREVFLDLVRRGDVLVENYRPGTLDRLDLGYEDLRRLNPRLIYAAISGFGHTGPWSHKPAYDMIVQALGGMMSVTGQPGGPPTKAGTSIGDISGGLFALAGITSALFHRERTGLGVKVDVSLLDGQIAILESAVLRYVTSGKAPGPMGNRHPSIAPFEPFATANRPLIIAAGNDAIFQRLCLTLGRPELGCDPRFASNRARLENIESLKTALEEVLRGAPAGHWIGVLEAAGVPCSLIHTVADAVEHPQIQARNMIVSAGGLRMAGNPIKFSDFPDPTSRRPAPELDADGKRIRQELATPLHHSPLTTHDLLSLLQKQGLIADPLTAHCRPLKGGVSSDIWLIETDGSRFVVKRALDKLRVQDDWFADISRNRHEQDYIDYVSRFLPEVMPRVLHRDPANGFFAMEYLGPEFACWKTLLLAGQAVPAQAVAAGRVLGTIHYRSWNDPEARARFDTTAQFSQLRIEPYLLTTGRRHPPLQAFFQEGADRLAATRLCLVHGDYSPKNILFGPKRMVILDCEVAWFGDPAFDVAFLLNHLFLKALFHAAPSPYLSLVGQAWQAYAGQLSPNQLAELEPRICRLLLMLLLARVDGKSPVEYLTDDARKNCVRSFVSELLPRQEESLTDLCRAWETCLDG